MTPFLRSILAVILTFSLVLNSSMVHADDSLVCGKDGGLDDYYSFLFTVRSEGTHRNYLGDFIGRSYCQIYDIMELYDQLETVKENFRTAAANCESTSQYKKQYYKILMEVYFIRNLIKWPTGAIHSNDAENLEEAKALILSNLKEEMEELFVNGRQIVSDQNFEAYWDEWSGKYEDRVGEYALCSEGPWGELQDTWQDFTQTLNDITLTIEAPERQSLKEIATPDTSDDLKALGEGIKGAWSYLKKRNAESERELGEPDSVSDLLESNPYTSLDEALNSLNDSEVYHSVDLEAARRMNHYTMLYGQYGSRGSFDIDLIVNEINAVVEESNNKDFPNIYVGASQVYDRQCN